MWKSCGSDIAHELMRNYLINENVFSDIPVFKAESGCSLIMA